MVSVDKVANDIVDALFDSYEDGADLVRDLADDEIPLGEDLILTATRYFERQLRASVEMALHLRRNEYP